MYQPYCPSHMTLNAISNAQHEILTLSKTNLCHFFLYMKPQFKGALWCVLKGIHVSRGSWNQWLRFGSGMQVNLDSNYAN